MKIGLVCPYNIARGGGVQEGVLAMQAGLKKRGHQVFIITPLAKDADQNPPPDTILVGTGTDFRYFNTTAQVSASTNPEEIQAILDLDFDILHFHEPWMPVLPRQLLSRSQAVNVATFHARMPDGVMSRTFERLAAPYTKSSLKYLDALTAVSDPAAQYVRSLTDHPVEIIPNGIDLRKYTAPHLPTPHSKRVKRILYVGRLEGRKGVKYLIDAFAALADPHARLLIGGDGPDREKLESYVHENDVPHVEFLGYLDEKHKLRLLRQADLFCSPALYGESFGIVLLEAMATGTVTVAGNNPGYVSVMRDRGALSLVNPQDTEEFARRLRLLLYDKDLGVLWRKWATAYVRQFDYENIVGQYESLYKRLLKRRT